MERERDWTVRFYRPEDEAGLLAVLQEAFDGWPRVDASVDAAQHLRWKLSSDPVAARHHIVAERNAAIVGARLCFVQRFELRGRTLLGRQGVDVCVAPGFRRQGIYPEMQRFALREQQEVYDLAVGNTGHASLLRLDHELGNRPFANEVGTLALDLASTFPHVARIAGRWSIREVTQFDDRIDGFSQEASRPFEFIAVRSHPYMNWRYCDRRAGTFVVRQAEQNGRMLGYAVLRLSRGKAYLADMLALPGQLDVVAALIHDAAAYVRGTGVPTLECCLPRHHPYRELLIECGFAEARRVIPLTYRAMQPDKLDLSFLQDQRAAIHLTLGDTDLV